MEVEDARHIVGEDGFVLVGLETVGMLCGVDELEEIYDVDEADLELGEMCAEECGGGKGFVGRDVAARGHDDVGLLTGVVAGPVPYSYSLGAVCDCLLHAQELEVLLLVRDDGVDIVCAAEAVVHSGEKTVGIWRKVDAYNLRALITDNVNEAGILVSETIVILAPHSRCEQDVE